MCILYILTLCTLKGHFAWIGNKNKNSYKRVLNLRPTSNTITICTSHTYKNTHITLKLQNSKLQDTISSRFRNNLGTKLYYKSKDSAFPILFSFLVLYCILDELILYKCTENTFVLGKFFVYRSEVVGSSILSWEIIFFSISRLITR